jgi:hypothetical protein
MSDCELFIIKNEINTLQILKQICACLTLIFDWALPKRKSPSNRLLLIMALTVLGKGKV